MDSYDNSHMANLSQLTLSSEYNTEDNDIIKELYAPCLNVSVKYDRAVGYFRANIYRELGEDLLDFVIRGGKVRIVCSPDIPEVDEDAARDGYDLRGTRLSNEVEASLVQILEVMAGNPDESDCLNMLRLLIQNGSLDLFVAVRPGGIYHRKIGMFTDVYGNKVVFSGSGNETQNAVTSVEDWSNDEEFDVFRSWGDEFERKKAISKGIYLEKLFSGGTRRTKVRLINETERDVINRFRSHRNFEDCRNGARRRSNRHFGEVRFEPYYFQRLAIKAWEEAGRIGILSMATGTGKTVTALFALQPLIRKGYPIIILVPSKILFDQWHQMIRQFYDSIPILLVGAGHDWKFDQSKRMYVADVQLPRVILATMHTASSEDFLEFLRQANNLVMVADEVHRLGSIKNRRILDIRFMAKLGLSATPERLFDNEGSAALLEAFGDQPVYNLPIGASVKLNEGDEQEVPILGHFLTPYYYDFVTLDLTAQEQHKWNEITKRINRLIAKDKSKKDFFSCNSKLQHLLIQRARIIKEAEAKVNISSQVIKSHYSNGARWIVYCENENQMNLVVHRLRYNNPHLPVLEYHSKMTPTARNEAISYFAKNPSIIVSIRCLDEGVDIPSADGALILASSKNPREYIQRRGRLLRKAMGKISAKIIDTLVLPNLELDDNQTTISIIRGEIARAYIFAQTSLNKEVTHRLWRICQEYGVEPEKDAQIGLEEDEEVENSNECR